MWTEKRWTRYIWGPLNPEEFTGQGNLPVALADGLGLEGAASSRVETASSTGAGALESAYFRGGFGLP